jgi:MFS family permease
MSSSNQARIFTASCVALIVTAMTFAIRAGILTQLGEDFGLSDTRLGWINGMAFAGFPAAIMISGLIYNLVGPKRMLWIAFIGHVLGLLLTITAGGFWGLLLSTFCIGFANGTVEGACNPLIADIYHENKTTMLNRFHVWFPGGIVIGSLVSYAMTGMDTGWQLQIGIMLIPTAIYGWMLFGLEFPAMAHSETSTAINVRSLATPLYIFMLVCMALTATTELGTQQWVERILGNSGASPMLVLAMVTGLMAIGRQFAGPVIHSLHPPRVLLFSSIIAAVGIYSMSLASGPMVYAAAVLFALGVMYFWPTMLGFVGEYLPRTGALGLSLMGGCGMFVSGAAQPVIGAAIDQARAAAVAAGMTPEAADTFAGQATLEKLALLPVVLIVLFLVLIIVLNKQGIRPARPEDLAMAKAAEMPQP